MEHQNSTKIEGQIYPPATKCAHDLATGTGFAATFDTNPDCEGPRSPFSLDCGKCSSCNARLLRSSVVFMGVFVERTRKFSGSLSSVAGFMGFEEWLYYVNGIMLSIHITTANQK